MQVYHMEIPALTEVQMSHLEARLPPDRRARLSGMRRAEVRAASLLGELAVRYLVGREVGVDPMDFIWVTGLYGKPFFERVDCHFNLSHSGSHLAIAVDDMPVGVDIECLRPAPVGLAERFFSPPEAEAVAASGGDASVFAGIWTVREAYIKWLGEGFHRTMQSFSLREPNAVQGPPDGYFRRYPGDGWMCAACSGEVRFPKDVSPLAAEEILAAFL